MPTKREISFIVPGQPKPQPRPRAYRRGKTVGVYDPRTAGDWKAVVALKAAQTIRERPKSGPVGLVVTYYLARPKRLCRKKDLDEPIPHIGRPDLDNLNKALLDALTTAGAYHDDGQVFAMQADKVYVAKGGVPYTEIDFWWYEECQPAAEAAVGCNE